MRAPNKFIIKDIKKRSVVALCDVCASRFISGWLGLVGCARVRVYDGETTEEWGEPRICMLCGSVGFWFEYVLPEWRR
ncbi:MAG: hypothetical protein QW424_03040 [Candidatus Bathyarchaeia archaeon]